jgi:hypothetical protein
MAAAELVTITERILASHDPTDNKFLDPDAVIRRSARISAIAFQNEARDRP